MAAPDQTHDPKRKSWIESANAAGGDFPVQNLPFGVFALDGQAPRGGVAIGDRILDLGAAAREGLFAGQALEAADAASGPTLNKLMALGPAHWTALRRRLSELLDADGKERRLAGGLAPRILVPMKDARLHLPARIGNYTDFFASSYHAGNTGRMLRPDSPDPLLPNYRWIPIAYHGRASSIRPRTWTTSSNSASISAPATPSVSRFRSPRRASACSACACSTTGRRATCRAGNTSPWGRSWPRASIPASRPGS
jgi:fumarylacetoacetase